MSKIFSRKRSKALGASDSQHSPLQHSLASPIDVQQLWLQQIVADNENAEKIEEQRLAEAERQAVHLAERLEEAQAQIASLEISAKAEAQRASAQHMLLCAERKKAEAAQEHAAEQSRQVSLEMALTKSLQELTSRLDHFEACRATGDAASTRQSDELAAAVREAAASVTHEAAASAAAQAAVEAATAAAASSVSAAEQCMVEESRKFEQRVTSMLQDALEQVTAQSLATQAAGIQEAVAAAHLAARAASDAANEAAAAVQSLIRAPHVRAPHGSPRSALPPPSPPQRCSPTTASHLPSTDASRSPPTGLLAVAADSARLLLRTAMGLPCNLLLALYRCMAATLRLMLQGHAKSLHQPLATTARAPNRLPTGALGSPLAEQAATPPRRQGSPQRKPVATSPRRRGSPLARLVATSPHQCQAAALAPPRSVELPTLLPPPMVEQPPVLPPKLPSTVLGQAQAPALALVVDRPPSPPQQPPTALLEAIKRSTGTLLRKVSLGQAGGDPPRCCVTESEQEYSRGRQGSQQRSMTPADGGDDGASGGSLVAHMMFAIARRRSTMASDSEDEAEGGTDASGFDTDGDDAGTESATADGIGTNGSYLEDVGRGCTSSEVSNAAKGLYESSEAAEAHGGVPPQAIASVQAKASSTMVASQTSAEPPDFPASTPSLSSSNFHSPVASPASLTQSAEAAVQSSGCSSLCDIMDAHANLQATCMVEVATYTPKPVPPMVPVEAAIDSSSGVSIAPAAMAGSAGDNGPSDHPPKPPGRRRYSHDLISPSTGPVAAPPLARALPSPASLPRQLFSPFGAPVMESRAAADPMRLGMGKAFLGDTRVSKHRIMVSLLVTLAVGAVVVLVALVLQAAREAEIAAVQTQTLLAQAMPSSGTRKMLRMRTLEAIVRASMPGNQGPARLPQSF